MDGVCCLSVTVCCLLCSVDKLWYGGWCVRCVVYCLLFVELCLGRVVVCGLRGVCSLLVGVCGVLSNVWCTLYMMCGVACAVHECALFMV